MKIPVLFVHSGGSQGPHEGSRDLVDYLQEALGDGYHVVCPPMPQPEEPHYQPWKELLIKELALLNDEVILVGHSLGGSVLLKFLSEELCPCSIAGLFLVAAPYWGKIDWYAEEYMLKPDFASCLPHIPYICLYHAHEDEVVPFSHLNAYATKLPTASVHPIDSRHHLFNAGIPELVRDIKTAGRKKLNVIR